jgi:hypothetical protein
MFYLPGWDYTRLLCHLSLPVVPLCISRHAINGRQVPWVLGDTQTHTTQMQIIQFCVLLEIKWWMYVLVYSCVIEYVVQEMLCDGHFCARYAKWIGEHLLEIMQIVDGTSIRPYRESNPHPQGQCPKCVSRISSVVELGDSMRQNIPLIYVWVTGILYVREYNCSQCANN